MGKDLKGKNIGKGISQRKDGLYEARFIDQNGKRRSLYSTSLTEVRKLLEDRRYEVKHGLFSDSPEITVDQWFDEWIKTYKHGKVKESTETAYVYTFKHISKRIGCMKLKSIKTIHLQKIINELADLSYAHSTLTLTRVTMHAMFEQALENEYIVKNPSIGVKLPTDTAKERRVLTIEEQKEFLQYAEMNEHYLAFKFALATGLRSGEVSGVMWDDINWENKELHVNRSVNYSKKENKFIISSPKTKSSIRTVPLTEETMEILQQQKKKQSMDKAKSFLWNKEVCFDGLIFTSKNGRPNGHSVYNNAIKSILRRINVDRMTEAKLNNVAPVLMEPFSFHTLRHSFATRCFESGMKTKIVQELLGHSEIGITADLYMHTTNEHLHEEMKKFIGVEVA